MDVDIELSREGVPPQGPASSELEAAGLQIPTTVKPLSDEMPELLEWWLDHPGPLLSKIKSSPKALPPDSDTCSVCGSEEFTFKLQPQENVKVTQSSTPSAIW